MSKMLIIAKAVLTAIGIYVMTIMLKGFLQHIRLIPFVLHAELLHRVLNYSLIFLFGVLAYQLIVRGDRWAHKIIGDTQTNGTEDILPFAISIYRITTVFCGVLIIYQAISTIEPYIRYFLNPEITHGHSLTIPGLAQWVLGLYLVFGAPHFVRWQANRTVTYRTSKHNDIKKAKNFSRKDTQ